MCSIDVITEELFFSLSADNKVNGNVEKPWGGKRLVQDPAKHGKKYNRKGYLLLQGKWSLFHFKKSLHYMMKAYCILELHQLSKNVP